jgi:hypothetical protein
MPVFRSGTFRDSMGIQHTWEDMHMTADGGQLQPPAQDGHHGGCHQSARATLASSPAAADIMDSLIGWHTSTVDRRARQPRGRPEVHVPAGTYEILDPTAIEKIDSGLWKNLSSEVGTWTSNAEAEYWPVYQGVAYVDFPAVEGLKTFASTNGVGSKFSIMSEESAVGTTDSPDRPAGHDRRRPRRMPPMPPRLHAPGPVVSRVRPRGPLSPGTPAAAQQPHLFTVNGQQISDFAAVQAHINVAGVLPAPRRSRHGRKEFVNGLVIVSQQDAGERTRTRPRSSALMLSRTSSSSSYKKQWENAPVLPQLANHTDGHDATTRATPRLVRTATSTLATRRPRSSRSWRTPSRRSA